MNDKTKNRVNNLMKQVSPKIEHKETTTTSEIEDELEQLIDRAEEIKIEKKPEKQLEKKEFKYLPYLMVPSFVEESTKAGENQRERRRQRVNILYDVNTARAQTPAFFGKKKKKKKLKKKKNYKDVSQDDPKTPLAFRYIRIILLTV